MTAESHVFSTEEPPGLTMAAALAKGKPPVEIPHVSWSMPVVWLESEKLVTRKVEDGVETDVAYSDVVSTEAVVTSLMESGKRPLFIALDPESLVQAVRAGLVRCPHRTACDVLCR
jgi:hypothetical protein